MGEWGVSFAVLSACADRPPLHEEGHGGLPRLVALMLLVSSTAVLQLALGKLPWLPPLVGWSLWSLLWLVNIASAEFARFGGIFLAVAEGGMWLQLLIAAARACSVLWPAAVHMAAWSGAKALYWPGVWGLFEGNWLPRRAAATLATGLAVWCVQMLPPVSDALDCLADLASLVCHFGSAPSFVSLKRCLQPSREVLSFHAFGPTSPSPSLPVSLAVQRIVNAALVAAATVHVLWRSSTHPWWFMGLMIAVVVVRLPVLRSTPTRSLVACVAAGYAARSMQPWWGMWGLLVVLTALPRVLSVTIDVYSVLVWRALSHAFWSLCGLTEYEGPYLFF